MKKVILFLFCISLVGVYSCNDPLPEVEIKDFMYLSLTGAVNNPQIKTLDLNNNRDTVFNISVSYGGTTNYKRGTIEATIEVDLSLVNQFNADNATNYQPMAAGTYELNANKAVIEDGKNSSIPLKLTIKKSAMDFSSKYLIPVTVKSISGGEGLSLNDDLKTLFIVIDVEVDDVIGQDRWKSGGASSVWQAGYEVEKAFDGNTSSYWHSEPFDASKNGLPQWFIVDMAGIKRVDGFTYNNRKDADQYALPKHIIFELSVDNVNWTKVLEIEELPDSRYGQVLQLRQTYIARYIRVTVLSNWSGNPWTYVAELSIYWGTPPDPEKPPLETGRENWTIVDQSSYWQNSMDWHPKNVLTEGLGGCWHTALDGLPQWFIIDMKKPLKITGILYANRQEDSGSEPKKIKFELSSDLETWETVLTINELSQTKDLQRLDCEKVVTGRYLRVTAETNWSGNGWTYVAYINVY